MLIILQQVYCYINMCGYDELNTKTLLLDGALTSQDGTKSLFMMNGNEWKTRRDIVYKLLMKMLSTKYLDKVLTNSMKYVLLNLKNGLWSDYHDIFQYIAFNALYHSNFGNDIHMNDDIYKTIMTDINDTLNSFPIGLMIIKQPILKYTLLRSQYKKLNQLKIRREHNIRKLINKRKLEYPQWNINPQTYIDYALSQMNESTAIADILILFSAGVETTANTLDFGVVLIGYNIDIQNKIRNELIKVCQKENIFKISKLKYCNLFRALVYEILRISSVGGTPGLRKVDKSFYITTKDGHKYLIPNDSTIHYNIEYIQRDSKEFRNNKNNINLNNWLDGDGKFKMNPNFVAFGIGKRNCLGMQFALNEIYVILGTLLLNYKWKILENDLKNVENALNHQRPFSRTLEPKIGIFMEKIK